MDARALTAQRTEGQEEDNAPETYSNLGILPDHQPAHDPVSLGIADSNTIASLKPGSTFQDPTTKQEFVIESLLADNDGRITYKARTPQEEEKTVKFIRSPRKVTSTLEERTRNELAHVNTAIQSTYSTFGAGPDHIAVIGPYVAGKNLRETLHERHNVYTEQEVITFLADVLQGELKDIHHAGLVHRDIKPDNIIAQPTDHGIRYKLIDFGSIKKDQSNLTTRGIDISLGYTRIAQQYTINDDFYALARTCYFLLEGEDPKFIDVKRLDEQYDKEKLDNLTISKKTKKILAKMLGHNPKKRYTSTEEILKDLGQLEGKKKKSTATAPIHLNAEQGMAYERTARHERKDAIGGVSKLTETVLACFWGATILGGVYVEGLGGGIAGAVLGYGLSGLAYGFIYNSTKRDPEHSPKVTRSIDDEQERSGRAYANQMPERHVPKLNG